MKITCPACGHEGHMKPPYENSLDIPRWATCNKCATGISVKGAANEQELARELENVSRIINGR